MLAAEGAAAIVTPYRGFAAGRVEIPQLDARGNVTLNEGPTDFNRNIRAIGTVNARMVFVDFPDAPGDAGGTKSIAEHLTGKGRAQTWFREQSYGRLDFRVSAIAGWRRMPRPAGGYTGPQHTFTLAQHKEYLSDVVALFPDLDMRANQILLVVAAKTDAIAISPTFIAARNQAVATSSGPVQWAVTFGKDSYTNRYINLCHEVCHTFGLPDLYNFAPFGFSAGAWDIMCDIFKGTGLLGWHRHKLGWLPPERATVLTAGRGQFTLDPLSGNDGTSMIVIATDHGPQVSKVHVVELAQPILGHDGTLTGDGVLVYSVDASVPTGKSPIQIIPASKEPNPNFGSLSHAPFQVGAMMSDPKSPFTLKVDAMQGDQYRIALALS